MRNPLVIKFVFCAGALVAGLAAAQPAMVTGDVETDLPDEVGPAVVKDLAPAGNAGGVSKSRVAVTTYHYDNLRTGWNRHETALTARNFPSTFGVLATVTLDDQVYAQPLIVPRQPITINGVSSSHDAVYVATMSNTIYAIDASTGNILLSRNLGPPIPLPPGCATKAQNWGILSTPVIDLVKATMYVVAEVNLGDSNSPNPSYQLHALKLSDLTERPGSPITVAASHRLTDGSTYTFNAAYQGQRPALLEQTGNIYAAFGSFCETEDGLSRGWLLGWTARTLAPLPANQLNDRQTSDPGVNPPFFVTGIWMSGYGIAGNGSDLFFSTGNSDCNIASGQCPSSTTYDGNTNIQESVVRLRGNLSHLVSIFTPGGPDYVLELDSGDMDQGSGGVLLLPSQRGLSLAVTAGKDGNLYLLNSLNLKTPLDTQTSIDGQGCWCGPSYFQGSDGIGRIVTSYGSFVQTWQVELLPSPHLVPEGSASIPVSEQDPGFFTVVSSNGTTPGSAIIWAVDRAGTDPNNPTTVHLYAFAATADSNGNLTQLFPSASPFADAGPWPYTESNANIVPVVANGKVYVASYQTLMIFGDTATSSANPAAGAGKSALQPRPIASPKSPHVITGTLLEVSGSMLTLKTRSGKEAKIDASQAIKNRHVGALKVGVPFTALGSSLNAAGALEATAVERARGSSGLLWPEDR